MLDVSSTIDIYGTYDLLYSIEIIKQLTFWPQRGEQRLIMGSYPSKVVLNMIFSQNLNRYWSHRMSWINSNVLKTYIFKYGLAKDKNEISFELICLLCSGNQIILLWSLMLIDKNIFFWTVIGIFREFFRCCMVLCIL